MKSSRPLVLSIWLAALVVAVVIILRTTISADMSAFLPERPTAEQQLLVSQLREGVLARTILIGLEGGDATERAEMSIELGRRMRESGDFLFVRNGANDTLARDEAALVAHRYLMSPAVNAQHFSVQGLHQAISDRIELLGSPIGALYKPLFTRDPTGETVALLEGLGDRDAPRSHDGAWVSTNGQRALLIAQTRADGANTDAQEALLARLDSQFQSVAMRYGITDGHLIVTGQPVFAVQTRAMIHHEIVRLSTISTIAVVVLLLLVYRSPVALALGILPIVTGALVGVAAVSLGFGGVHGLTIGFGTTLMGEALDYTVYYFVQAQQGGAATADWRARFWPTIRLGMLTSVCGFASLLFSGFPGLAQLGLYSIAGLAAAAAVTRFVLPELRPASLVIPRFGAIEDALPRLVARIGRFAPLVLALAAAAILSLAFSQKPIWYAGLSGLNPLPLALEEDDVSLRHDLGAPALRYLIVVTTPERETTLIATEEVAHVLDALEPGGAIGGYDAPTRFLPSQATQQARRAALPTREELSARLREALVGLPVKPERLTPFVDDVAAARAAPLIEEQDLADTSFQLGVDSLLISQAGQVSAVLPLRARASADHPDIDADAIRGALNHAGVKGAVFVDLLAESNRLYSDYLHEAIALSCAGMAAITLLLGIALRSVQRVLRVLVPLAAAVLVVIAGLSLLGERLTLLHLVGTLLIVAVGSNYALFFDREELGVTRDGRILASLLLANLATVVGFGALATSSVPVLRAIGVTVGPGAILAMLFSLALSRQRKDAV